MNELESVRVDAPFPQRKSGPAGEDTPTGRLLRQELVRGRQPCLLLRLPGLWGLGLPWTPPWAQRVQHTEKRLAGQGEQMPTLPRR